MAGSEAAQASIRRDAAALRAWARRLALESRALSVLAAETRAASAVAQRASAERCAARRRGGDALGGVAGTG
jgi:hypothetical protein